MHKFIDAGVHVDNVYMGRGTPDLYTIWTPFGDIGPDLGTPEEYLEYRTQCDAISWEQILRRCRLDQFSMVQFDVITWKRRL